MVLDVMKFFAEFIRSEIGIVYEEVNFYQLEQRLQDVAKRLGYASVELMYEEARRTFPSTMKALLLDAALNHETMFFRDPAIFHAIRDTVLAAAKSSSQRVPFRIWCAACSFGQEVYSLAMMLQQAKDLPSGGYEIVATDISAKALSIASEGVYTSLQIQRGLTQNELDMYFSRLQNDRWQVKSFLKNHVQFQKLNLLEPFAQLGTFDLILCRNVLIYQAVPKKQEIIHRICDRLSSGGFLILGSSESLLGLSNAFNIVRMSGATLFQKTDLHKEAG